MSIMTREELDAMGCSNPDCTHEAHTSEMYIHSTCHVESPLTVAYFDGVLVLSCAACGRTVGSIAVKD